MGLVLTVTQKTKKRIKKMKKTKKEIINYDNASNILADLIEDKEYNKIKKFIYKGLAPDSQFNGFIPMFLKTDNGMNIELYAGGGEILARHTARIGTHLADYELPNDIEYNSNAFGILQDKQTKEFKSKFSSNLSKVFEDTKDKCRESNWYSSSPDLDTWSCGGILMLFGNTIVNTRKMFNLEFNYWINLEFLKKMFSYCGNQFKLFKPNDSTSPIIFEGGFHEVIAMPVKVKDIK